MLCIYEYCRLVVSIYLERAVPICIVTTKKQKQKLTKDLYLESNCIFPSSISFWKYSSNVIVGRLG